jgi:SP family sugar:H+ symporter-like MFS transporter
VPLILGGVWQSIWLFVFAIVGTIKDPTTNPDVGYGMLCIPTVTVDKPSQALTDVSLCLSPVMIVSACMFILGYSFSWSPGIWILIGETFPTRTRARQGALATSANWYVVYLVDRSSKRQIIFIFH